MTTDVPLAFRYLRRETLVATQATMHVEWLRDCLEPHFCAQAAPAGDWSVAFSADPDGYRALASQRRASGDEIPFFTLDSRLVALPQWNGGRAGDVVAFDEEFDVFYTVRRDRRVDVLATDLRPRGRRAASWYVSWPWKRPSRRAACSARGRVRARWNRLCHCAEERR